MHNMFQKVYRQIQTFYSKIDVWYLEKDRGDDDNDDDDDDNCVNHQPGYDATCVRQVTSTKTQILKSNGRKRKIDIHVNSDFKRAYFMSEEDKRASADSYCLWSTKGEIDCSQCKKLNTPLFLFSPTQQDFSCYKDVVEREVNILWKKNIVSCVRFKILKKNFVPITSGVVMVILTLTKTGWYK